MKRLMYVMVLLLVPGVVRADAWTDAKNNADNKLAACNTQKQHADTNIAAAMAELNALALRLEDMEGDTSVPQGAKDYVTSQLNQSMGIYFSATSWYNDGLAAKEDGDSDYAEAMSLHVLGGFYADIACARMNDAASYYQDADADLFVCVLDLSDTPFQYFWPHCRNADEKLDEYGY